MLANTANTDLVDIYISETLHYPLLVVSCVKTTYYTSVMLKNVYRKFYRISLDIGVYKILETVMDHVGLLSLNFIFASLLLTLMIFCEEYFS